MFFILILTSLANVSPCYYHIAGCKVCDDSKSKCKDCDGSQGFMEFLGRCICDESLQYYDAGNNKCQKATSENCEVLGCLYCFEPDDCKKCDSTLNFALLSDNKCGCLEDKNFKPEPINGKCVCEEGYYSDKELQCNLIKYENCRSGCTSCVIDSICLTCKDGFILKDGKCECEEGYFLDEQLRLFTKKERCSKIFPEVCPEGCNCDKNFVCTSCKENYIAEYYDDEVTIYECLKINDCQNPPAGCKKCSEEQKCLQCEDDYFYSKYTSSCIKREIPPGDCRVSGCVKCDSEDSCLACEPEYDQSFSDKGYSCSLRKAETKNINYILLSDKIVDNFNNIIINENEDTTINLQNLDLKQRRPFSYKLEKDINNIYINNDILIDFQIDCTEARDKNIKIAPAKGSNPNPKLTLQCFFYGQFQFNLQTTKASFINGGELTLYTDNDIIEIDNVFMSRYSYKFHLLKNIKINEVHVYDIDTRDNYIEFIQNTRSEYTPFISTLHLHRLSEVALKGKVEIGTLICETASKVEAENGASFQEIEVNFIQSYLIGGGFYFINGNIIGVPKSIKINSRPANKSLSGDSVKNFVLVTGTNAEFAENCEQWAKLYNDNPTDEIYNHADCTKNNFGTYLDIKYIKKEEPKAKGKSKAGIIAGCTVAGVVVVGVVVFLLVYFLVIKKRKNDFNNSSAEDDNA